MSRKTLWVKHGIFLQVKENLNKIIRSAFAIPLLGNNQREIYPVEGFLGDLLIVSLFPRDLRQFLLHKLGEALDGDFPLAVGRPAAEGL